VLRIILKLDDIEIAVGGAHEVRLRASTHTPHVLVDEDRQIPARPFCNRKSGSVYQYWRLPRMERELTISNHCQK